MTVPFGRDSCSPSGRSLPSQQTVTSCTHHVYTHSQRDTFAFVTSDLRISGAKDLGWTQQVVPPSDSGRWTSSNEMFHLSPPPGWKGDGDTRNEPPHRCRLKYEGQLGVEKGEQSLCKAISGHLVLQMNFLPYSPTVTICVTIC